jgi:hypothetical protein
MRFQRSIIFIVALTSLALFHFTLKPVSAQNRSAEAQVEAIRREYVRVNQLIEKAQPCREKGENYESIFCTEIDVNKGGRSRNNYPAVGTYEEVHRFFYDYGKEEGEYPDTLVKATSTSYNAARRYNAEFLFNQEGELIFYYSKAEADKQPEVRCYFAKGAPIRLIKDGVTIAHFSKDDTTRINEIISNAKKIKELFATTLELPTGFYEPDEND